MTEDEIRQIVRDEIEKTKIIVSVITKKVDNNNQFQDVESTLIANLSCPEQANQATIRAGINDD